jgi:alpha-ketoglutarate-dependent taurine dioxygenase
MHSPIEPVGEPLAEADVALVDGGVRLTVGDESLELEAVWLRDSATDPESRDPVSGQRLFGITDVPPDLRVVSATVSDGRLQVGFEPGGQRAAYDVAELLEEVRSGHRDDRNEQGKHLWRTAADLGPVKPTPWSGYLADQAPALRSVVRDGFALLSGVPQVEGTVTEVAETFGFVRETNYGRIFDVRVEENATNLAFTGRAITPHTDNPYRDPVPTLQLLHCLRNAAAGGDSGLVDGFAAAAVFRERHPAEFETLTGTPVSYRFDSADAHVSALAPMIGVDAAGFVREIRFNNRSLRVPALLVDDARRFYAAYRTFAELVLDPAAQLNLRLAPGDCLIFDNTRILHARTAFEGVGARHLQGTYADIDGLLSTLATLEAAR